MDGELSCDSYLSYLNQLESEIRSDDNRDDSANGSKRARLLNLYVTAIEKLPEDWNDESYIIISFRHALLLLTTDELTARTCLSLIRMNCNNAQVFIAMAEYYLQQDDRNAARTCLERGQKKNAVPQELIAEAIKTLRRGGKSLKNLIDTRFCYHLPSEPKNDSGEAAAVMEAALHKLSVMTDKVSLEGLEAERRKKLEKNEEKSYPVKLCESRPRRLDETAPLPPSSDARPSLTATSSHSPQPSPDDPQPMDMSICPPSAEATSPTILSTPATSLPPRLPSTLFHTRPTLPIHPILSTPATSLPPRLPSTLPHSRPTLPIHPKLSTQRRRPTPIPHARPTPSRVQNRPLPPPTLTFDDDQPPVSSVSHRALQPTPQPHPQPQSQPHNAFQPQTQTLTALQPQTQPLTTQQTHPQPHLQSHTSLQPQPRPHTALQPQPRPYTALQPQPRPHTALQPQARPHTALQPETHPQPHPAFRESPWAVRPARRVAAARQGLRPVLGMSEPRRAIERRMGKENEPVKETPTVVTRESSGAVHGDPSSVETNKRKIDEDKDDAFSFGKVPDRRSIRVNGKTYLVNGVIGRGGSSVVYQATSEAGDVLAIKVVSFDKQDENVIVSYKNEVDILLRLQDTGRVIRLFNHEITSRGMALVMERAEVDFKSVHAHLTHKNAKRDVSSESGSEGRTAGPHLLDADQVVKLWKEMLECVDALHNKGVVHLDLKPSNFVLVNGTPKLIDLGISHSIPDDKTSVTLQHTMGTLDYMSPEQLSSFTDPKAGEKGLKNRIGRSSDVWALGCILHLLMFGKPPFRGTHILERMTQIISDQPVPISDYPALPKLKEILEMCLQKNPVKRPSVSVLLKYFVSV